MNQSSTDVDGVSPSYPSPLESSISEGSISRGAELIRQFGGSLNIHSCVSLVEAWIAKGINLALAEKFTTRCAQTTKSLLRRSIASKEGMELSRKLFRNSYSSLKSDINITEDSFYNQFCGDNARWETIGIFFTALTRATVDLAVFEPLYHSQQQRRTLQKLVTHYSDICLDVSLSLDCLNDLQLALQYENFILHSFIHGDQSKWKDILPKCMLISKATNHGGNLVT